MNSLHNTEPIRSQPNVQEEDNHNLNEDETQEYTNESAQIDQDCNQGKKQFALHAYIYAISNFVELKSK